MNGSSSVLMNGSSFFNFICLAANFEYRLFLFSVEICLDHFIPCDFSMLFFENVKFRGYFGLLCFDFFKFCLKGVYFRAEHSCRILQLSRQRSDLVLGLPLCILKHIDFQLECPLRTYCLLGCLMFSFHLLFHLGNAAVSFAGTVTPILHGVLQSAVT